MIYLILIFGILLRLISLNQSLWLDEGITAQIVRNSTFLQLIIEFPKFDLHPPGYYLLLWVWSRIFGFSEIALRLPSVIMAMGVVYLVFVITKDFGGKKVGWLAAWLLTINPLFLYYSQEMRMYMMATLAVLVNFYYFEKLVKQGKYWGFAISAMVVLMTDYVAYFSFLAELVVVLVWFRKSFKNWILGLVPAGLVFGAWIPIFFTQLTSGISLSQQLPVWQKVVGGFDLKALILTGVKIIFGRISLENKWLYGILSGGGGLIYLVIIIRGVLYDWKKIQTVVIMGIVPIILAWLGSGILPIFSYFRVLFCVPFIMIILALVLSRWNRWGVVLIVAISLISIVSGGIYLSRPEFQREDWRGLVLFLDQKQSNSSIVILESDGSFAPYDYYNQGKIKTVYGLQKFPASESSDLINLDSGLAEINKVYLLEYLVDIADPSRMVEQSLKKIGFKLEKIDNFHGVGFVREFVR